MQTLLERRGGNGMSPPSRNQRHALVVLVCIGLAAYVALVLLPTLSLKEIGEEPNAPTNQPVPTLQSARPRAGPSTDLTDDTKPSFQLTETLSTTKKGLNPPGQYSFLTPWGYNTERNLVRWKAIYQSVSADQSLSPEPFTVVDYGSDQGYFSISFAHAFPNAFVMGIEAGGVGGSIWVKKGKGPEMDVLKIQESKLKELSLTNVYICQAKAHQRQFTQLNEKGSRSRYQLVLSVFHWFQLETAEAFQTALIEMFRNAQTTFIELPTIGDRGPLIRKQVGWKNFNVWYQGHNNVQEVIEAAAKAKGVAIKVSLLVSAPWLQWTRDVFRVDFLSDEDHLSRDPVPRSAFGCEHRVSIYGCAKRENFAECQ
jgi:hypothetical protein